MLLAQANEELLAHIARTGRATPDAKWVEAVTAAVVVRAGSEVDAAALIAHCRGQLAPFKCPKRVEIVDALPKNPAARSSNATRAPGPEAAEPGPARPGTARAALARGLV